MGVLEMWVDILTPEEATTFLADDISLPPTVTFEVMMMMIMMMMMMMMMMIQPYQPNPPCPLDGRWGCWRCWVDILTPEGATTFLPDDISLPPTATFEVMGMMMMTTMMMMMMMMIMMMMMTTTMMMMMMM
jgi:hypothetical protein